MPDIPYFEARPYYEALLEGSRVGFRLLQQRHATGHIYFYGLRMSSSYHTVEPCIKSEERLDEDAQRLLWPLLRRGRSATLGEVRLALRYETPGGDFCIRAREHRSLETANDLLAEFARRWDALFNSLDTDGNAQQTPVDKQVEAAMMEAPREVLRVLDAERLFGTGEARRAVVLDLCWTEGGAPDAVRYLLFPEDDLPAPLNSPDVHAAYLDELVKGRAMHRALFSG